MRVSNIKPTNFVKTTMIMLPLLCSSVALQAQKRPKQDVFIKTEKIVNIEPNVSIEDMAPALKLGNDTIYPALVVDLRNKKMYEYYYDTVIKDIHKIDSTKKTSRNLSSLNIIKKIERNKGGNTLVILQEVDVLTGKPINESLKVITDSREQFVKSKNALILKTKALNEVVKLLDLDQYVWIK